MNRNLKGVNETKSYNSGVKNCNFDVSSIIILSSETCHPRTASTSDVAIVDRVLIRKWYGCNYVQSKGRTVSLDFYRWQRTN